MKGRITSITATITSIMLAGCTTVRHVPLETTRTDSIRITTVRADTLRIADSTVVDRSSDTVRIERWRTVWRERFITDTIVSVSRDTIHVPYPIETRVQVPAPIHWWQKILMLAGALSFLVITVRSGSFFRR